MRLAVTTWGSSSAPAVVTGARAEGQRLTSTAERRNPGGGVISADLSAYVTVIETPSGLDPGAPAVVVMGSQEYDLPPASEQGDDPYIVVEPARPPPGW
ncbi:hypothetical protein [Blastococcus montanus]|uniref:hypothetical protein n=1 Tax=Blastococcus montanus TaxID=3144973 RepID=UPI0032083F98